MNTETPVSRPILFSAPMVQAILAGRKTQTRRTLKHQPIDILPMNGPPGREWIILESREPDPKGKVVRCRLGAPGDHLWVRETCVADDSEDVGEGVRYLADDAFVPIADTDEARALWINLSLYRVDDAGVPTGKPVPSIHMPRWASRITLRITDVRVQQLQRISEADCIAEGMEPQNDEWGCGWRSYEIIHQGRHKGKASPHARVANRSPLTSYRELWEAINGPKAWDENPWVWAVSFERVT